MKFSNLRALAHGALALLLAACGGGGADGGIGGTGGGGGVLASDVSVGTITAFGSVWVNGVEFKSTGSTIKIDDNPHPESDLRVGMVAKVGGSISSARADTINVSSAAKGRVESVNGNTMVVMGQTVVTDGATVFENGVHPVAGDYAEVHGFVVSSGTISATYVEKKAAPVPLAFAVKGIVNGHAPGGATFTVGALIVTLGAGAITNDMPAGASWNGIQVEIKGTACAGNPICGTLTASKVEPHTPLGNVSRVEVEGFVVSGTSASFTVGSQAVVTTGSTVFQGGVAADLVPGTKVEVEGSLSGGVLTATKVSFRESIRFEANIATKVGTSLTLTGINGVTVETNSLTRFKNVQSQFANLAVGNNLKIRARPGSNGTIVATEIEQKSTSPDTRVILQAVASAVVAPPTETVTLLGITINTSLINSFKDITDAIISRAAFYQQAAPGKLIKVRGSLAASTITWDQEIQLED